MCPALTFLLARPPTRTPLSYLYLGLPVQGLQPVFRADVEGASQFANDKIVDWKPCRRTAPSPSGDNSPLIIQRLKYIQQGTVFVLTPIAVSMQRRRHGYPLS